MYDRFATVYDRLMEDVDYTAWARHYVRLLGENGEKGRRVYDAACGTGSMTLALRKLGLNVTGAGSRGSLSMILFISSRSMSEI